MSPHAATYRAALEWLDFHLGYMDPLMPLRAAGLPVFWHRCGTGTLSDVVEALERDNREVRIGLPERARGAGPSRATVLWARVEGPDQLERAQAMRPRPSLVVSEGSTRRWLLWPLLKPVGHEEAVRANRRVAYALGAVQKIGTPELFALPAPGSVLRVGRARPRPVVVTRMTDRAWRAGEVAGALKDPPEATWMEAAA